LTSSSPRAGRSTPAPSVISASTAAWDLNIAIRTFLLQGDRAWFQAGGGIVADSQPESEYDETAQKARALIEAVRTAISDF